MFNKWRRCFYSSRVNFLSSKCLQAIQINPVKQPITCNSVGPWHMSHCWTSTLIIILMTASLSSKMYNWDSPWEQCAFARTWFNYDNCWTSRFPYGLVLDGLNKQSPVSYLFPNPGLVSVLALFVERNTSITTSHKSTAGNLSVRNPASNAVISDSVELWDTDFCFLHIQQEETNVRHPNVHKIPPDVDFLSPQSRQQGLSLEISPIDNVVVHFQHGNIDDSLLCDECMISILPIVYHKLVSILCGMEQVCSLNMACLVCQFVQETKIFKKHLWSNFWWFSNWFQIFLLELVVIQARTGQFVKLLCLFFFASSQYLSTHFLIMSFNVSGPSHVFCMKFVPPR